MEDTTSAKGILERLRQGTGAKSDSELGRMVGVSQQAIYNARNGNKLPDAWVRRAAQQFNLSMDWLYFGEGNMYRTGADNVSSGSTSGVLKKEILKDVIEVLEEFLIEEERELPPAAKAEVISELYELILEGEISATQPIRMFRVIRGALAASG